MVGGRGRSYGLLGAARAARSAITKPGRTKGDKPNTKGCEVSVSLVQWKLERPYLALPARSERRWRVTERSAVEQAPWRRPAFAIRAIGHLNDRFVFGHSSGQPNRLRHSYWGQYRRAVFQRVNIHKVQLYLMPSSPAIRLSAPAPITSQPRQPRASRTAAPSTEVMTSPLAIPHGRCP